MTATVERRHSCSDASAYARKHVPPTVDNVKTMQILVRLTRKVNSLKERLKSEGSNPETRSHFISQQRKVKGLFAIHIHENHPLIRAEIEALLETLHKIQTEYFLGERFSPRASRMVMPQAIRLAAIPDEE